MPINPITMRHLWAVFTGILAAGMLIATTFDIGIRGYSSAVAAYGTAAALSVLCRWRSIHTQSWMPVAAAGLFNAAVTGTALGTLFTPGVELAVAESTGIYLMLGIWILMMDVVYREIELGLFRRRWTETAGE